METPIDIVEDALKNNTWAEHSGTCDIHGESTIQVPARIKAKWFCRDCEEIKRKAEVQAEWLRDRNETLHRIADIPRKYRGQKFAAITASQKAARATVKAFRDFVL